MTNARVVAFALAVGVLAALPAACSSSQSLAAAGQACLNATDCQPGLVCVPDGTGTERACSDDLSGIQKTESTDSGAAMAAEGGKKEGGSTDAGGMTQDTFQPPVDSGAGG